MSKDGMLSNQYQIEFNDKISHGPHNQLNNHFATTLKIVEKKKVKYDHLNQV